jgi:hypothetical protein
MELTLNQYTGYILKGPDGVVGTVCDFYFDDHSWMIRYLGIETGEWLKNRKILIPPAVLLDPDNTSKTYPARLSRKQIQTSPYVDIDHRLSRSQESQLHDYFSWPKYWDRGDDDFSGANFPRLCFMNPSELNAKTHILMKETESELKRTTNLIGCEIHSLEIVLGKIFDFIIEDSNWQIRYLVIEVDNSVSQKKLLIDCRHLVNVKLTANVLELNL